MNQKLIGIKLTLAVLQSSPLEDYLGSEEKVPTSVPINIPPSLLPFFSDPNVMENETGREIFTMIFTAGITFLNENMREIETGVVAREVLHNLQSKEPLQ